MFWAVLAVCKGETADDELLKFSSGRVKKLARFSRAHNHGDGDVRSFVTQNISKKFGKFRMTIGVNVSRKNPMKVNLLPVSNIRMLVQLRRTG